MSTQSFVTLPHGYRWLCVADPNELFLGGIFRKADLSTETDDELLGHWAEGCIFRHVRKPLYLTIIDGMITMLETAPTGGVDH